MAEAVLVVALENLTSLISEELRSFLGVDREMERLFSTLTTIRAVLEDAEEKQLTNRALKNWLDKLKDAAHVLDDILDECATEALELEYQGLKFGSAHKVGGSCLSSFHPKHALFHYKIAKKMKGIRERLDEISEERIKFHLRETATERRIEVVEWRQTTSIITEPQVYGREEDKEKIVDFLVSHASDCDDLTVYPIIGIGGLGKTTLVQIVFNDERIVNHFELKFWVCGSEDFSLKRMLKAVIESVSRQACEDLDSEPLQRKLQELLQRKRYLLVLDDVWNDNQEKCDKLKYVLACGSKGASILVTTRLTKVASIMGTIHPHQLSSLSEDHCWELFRQRAFGEGRFKMHDLVHDLAQSVMEEECRCITVDNNMTHLSKRTRHLSLSCYWPRERLSSELHQVKTLKTFISSTLCPSELPHARHSLRVLEVGFRKEISSSIGHFKHLRYLNLSHGRFKTLPNSITRLWNLQILNLDYCGNLQKLPDHLNCLKFLRHLHLDGCYSLSRLAPDIGQLNFLRTLNIYIVGKQRGFHLAELRRLNVNGKLHIKHLERVRSVSDAKEANMASKHLNQLFLSWEKNEEYLLQKNVEQILEALQPYIRKLQTLRVEGYMGFHYPQWMGSPTVNGLYHIELVDCPNCLRLSPLGHLPSLKNLKLYNMDHVQYVDDDESYNGGVAKGFKALEFLELRSLPSLIRWSKEDSENMFPCLSELKIIDCPELSLPCLPSIIELLIHGQHKQASLGSIQNLRSLESLGFFFIYGLTSFPDGMLYGLTCLKKLCIYGYGNLELLPTELNNLNALEELHIEQCDILEPLTEQVLQGLTSLKILKINDYPKFKLSAGFQYLTSLEDLSILRCQELEDFPEALQHLTTLQSLSLFILPNLVSLPSWLGNLRSLQSLRIYNCPKLTSLPMSIQCLGSLKSLEIEGCPELLKRCEKETGEDWHKVAHVPRIGFDNGGITERLFIIYGRNLEG